MTDLIGETKAKIFADAHEAEFLVPYPEETFMDYHNNALGRRIAIEYVGQGYDVFAQKIREAIENGEAYVRAWDASN